MYCSCIKQHMEGGDYYPPVRDDLVVMENKEWAFCPKCGRHHKWTMVYVGHNLEVSQGWVPTYQPWEKGEAARQSVTSEISCDM